KPIQKRLEKASNFFFPIRRPSNHGRPLQSRPPMSHRKTDLGIPCRAKSAKVVLSPHLFPESPAGGTGAPIWMQVELSAGRLHVRRSKRGTPSVHPMQGDEIRALRRLQSEQGPTVRGGGPMSPKSSGTLFTRLGERADEQRIATRSLRRKMARGQAERVLTGRGRKPSPRGGLIFSIASPVRSLLIR